MEQPIAQHLSARVESAIKEVLGSDSDSFDGPTFDPIAFINSKFSTEESLSGLEDMIKSYKGEITRLDENILQTVRDQSTAGTRAAQDIEEAKHAIGDLYAKIIEIRKKADASEELVEGSCKSIRGLDIAKGHLEDSIKKLNGLKQLAINVRNLKEGVEQVNYEMVASDLASAVDILATFAQYHQVPKLTELRREVEVSRQNLRESIARDMDNLLDKITPDDLSYEFGRSARPEVNLSAPGTSGSQDASGPPAFGEAVMILRPDKIATLRAAAVCIDAIGPVFRKEILSAYFRKQMQAYSKLFDAQTGTGVLNGKDLARTMDGVPHRFKWFFKAVSNLETRDKAWVPGNWRLMHRFAVEFCQKTRKDLQKILQSFASQAEIQGEWIFVAMEKTQQFEKTLDSKYYFDPSAQQSSSALPGMEPEEAFDMDAPLYNKNGELVDPTTAEGIRLKYKRKQEWEESKAHRQAKLAEQAHHREYIANLVGLDYAAASTSKIYKDRDAILVDEISALPKFINEDGSGIISSVFKDYMHIYAKLEGKHMQTVVEEDKLDDETSTGSSVGLVATVSLLMTSSKLVKQISNSVQRCTRIDRGQTLLHVFNQAKQALKAYSIKLMGKLPKSSPPGSGVTYFADAAKGGEAYLYQEAETVPLINSICLIINTAQYCADTLTSFADSITNVLNPPTLASKVDVEDIENDFLDIVALGIQTLAAFSVSSLDMCWKRVLALPWHSVTEIGDNSPYVGDIERLAKLIFPFARNRLSPSHFRSFTDRYARYFLARYTGCVKQCKRISMEGAKQMRLDLGSIKNILLSTPVMLPLSDKKVAMVLGARSVFVNLDEGEDTVDAETTELEEASPVFVKFVTTEISRLDSLLKTIETPVEHLADFICERWPNVSANDIKLIAEMKGLSEKDHKALLVRRGLAKQTTVSNVASNVTSNVMSSFSLNLPFSTKMESKSGSTSAANTPTPQAPSSTGTKSKSSASGTSSQSGLGLNLEMSKMKTMGKRLFGIPVISKESGSSSKK